LIPGFKGSLLARGCGSVKDRFLLMQELLLETGLKQVISCPRISEVDVIDQVFGWTNAGSTEKDEEYYVGLRIVGDRD
jgi:hypothetical protein